MRQISQWLIAGVFLFLMSCGAADSSYVWYMDSAEEIRSFGNDGSGAQFVLYEENAVAGNASMRVIPSGSSGETKVALPLHGEKLNRWTGHEKVQVRIYRPENNHLNPEHFFMGMADVTGGEWSWQGGINGDASELKPGWNEITYTLTEDMRNLQEGSEYTLFLAFSAYMPPREDGVRVPLYEYFLIDGIKML